MASILIIDDKKDNLISFTAILKTFMKSIQILTATSGEEGLKIAKERLPDIILLDIQMPVMDGYEVCKKLKKDKTTNHILVILITAFKTDSKSRAIGLEIGADAYLAKPVDPEELVAQVKAMLRIKEAEDQLREQNINLAEIVEKKTRELSKSELKHRMFYENSPLPLQSFDEHGIITDVNPAWLDLMGYNAKSVIGKPFINFLELESIQTFNLDFETSKLSKEPWTSLFIMKKEDRSVITVSFDAQVGEDPVKKELRIYCVFKDVSAEEKYKKQLKEQEENYRNLHDFAGAGISAYAKDGTIISMNNIALDRLGAVLKDVQGKSLYELFSKKVAAVFIERIQQTATSGKTKEYISKVSLPDGKKYFLTVYTARKDDEGNIMGVQSISLDITNQKKAEKELIRAKEKAEESDRLKTSFLSTMSHEIRTPLNAILGFSEILTMPDLQAEQKKEYISLIMNNGESLLQIINDILDLSLIEADQMKIIKKDVNINDLIEELESSSRQILKLKGRSNIELLVNKPPGKAGISIYTDPYRLNQIFSNLIDNAIKFTESGKIIIGYRLINDIFEFYVQDTGIGIPKEKQEIIFDRFRQADDTDTREFGGVGLGLAIVNNLVTLLEGSIHLDSIDGKGTIITIQIPNIKTQDQIIEPEEERTPTKIDLSDYTILVAEDNMDNYYLIHNYLSQNNASIIHAQNGKEAINICNNQNHIDLILMDIRMPVLNGLIATEVIKKSFSNIPIIALTAHALTEDRKKALDAGCDDFIVKPIRKDDLLTLISKYL